MLQVTIKINSGNIDHFKLYRERAVQTVKDWETKRDAAKAEKGSLFGGSEDAQMRQWQLHVRDVDSAIKAYYTFHECEVTFDACFSI